MEIVKEARNWGLSFWVIPINVLCAFCLALFIIGSFTGPVNVANVSNFSIFLRYMEFWAYLPLEAAISIVFLYLPFGYFASISKMRDISCYSHYNAFGKRSAFFLFAEKLHHHGIKGIVAGGSAVTSVICVGLFRFFAYAYSPNSGYTKCHDSPANDAYGTSYGLSLGAFKILNVEF